MYNFCTLFDSNYLTRGLALYESLQSHCDDFTLYVFAFDDKCYDILNKLNLAKAVIISLKEFENEKLLEAKKTRSRGEYCWTCSSSSILYVLENFNVTNCTYLDADVYFFGDPKLLISELPKDKSVIITEHRYPPHYAIMETNGKFCVQFVYFQNNEKSKKVLIDWANKCINWCYGRWEDNKFGDQKYLDEWPQKFSNIHILKNEGGGLAPWNLYNYKLKQNEDNFEIRRKKGGASYKVIFYHFHDLRFYDNKTIQLTGGYFMVPSSYKKLYYIYINHLKKLEKKILEMDNTLNPNCVLKKTIKEKNTNSKGFFRKLVDKLADKDQLKSIKFSPKLIIYNFVIIFYLIKNKSNFIKLKEER